MPKSWPAANTMRMNTYRIRIRMPDGSQGNCLGLFSDAFAAILQILEDFPDAKSITARRVPA